MGHDGHVELPPGTAVKRTWQQKFLPQTMPNREGLVAHSLLCVLAHKGWWVTAFLFGICRFKNGPFWLLRGIGEFLEDLRFNASFQIEIFKCPLTWSDTRITNLRHTKSSSEMLTINKQAITKCVCWSSREWKGHDMGAHQSGPSGSPSLSEFGLHPKRTFLPDIKRSRCRPLYA